MSPFELHKSFSIWFYQIAVQTTALQEQNLGFYKYVSCLRDAVELHQRLRLTAIFSAMADFCRSFRSPFSIMASWS